MTATMHFRFGNKAGSVDLDDIHVVDLDDGREVMPRCDFEDGPASLTRAWTAWPPGEKNTVGRVEVKAGAGQSGSAAMHVELRAPANGQWPDFHIYHHANLRLTRGHRHRVTFWVNARPERELTVGFYRPGATYVHLGGPPGPFESQIRMAAGAGVNFVSFPIDLPWPKPGQPADWSAVDLACQQVLAANPRALLLPRMGMTPPDWWQEEHRDDVMQWENGRRGLAVVASPVYRRDAAERLRDLVAHLEARFGDHVAGYHPCGQNTGEWFYEGTWETPLSGYAVADQIAWRLWLKGRYRSDPALQAAWHDAKATLETASAPSPALRHAAPAGVFRDPARASADRLGRVPARGDEPVRVRPGPRGAGGVGRPEARGLLLRLPLRVRRGSHRSAGLRPLCAPPRARLSRHRHPLLADLVLRSRPGARRTLHDGGRERGPGRQDVAQRGRHPDLPGDRRLPRRDRCGQHAGGYEPGAGPQRRPGGHPQFRHLVDGPWRHRLVQRPPHVAGDGAPEGDRRAAAGAPLGVSARGCGRDRRARHAAACSRQHGGDPARHLRGPGRSLAAWVLLTASTCSTTCWPDVSMPGSSSCSTPGG